MIIDLRTILHGPRQFEFTLKAGWWQSDKENDQVLGLRGPLRVQMNIYGQGGKFVLSGHLYGTAEVRCDRCLEPYPSDLDCDFSLSLVLALTDSDQKEIELLEEDMSIDLITENEVDLYEIVREQIYLSLPMKFLCREDCSGLCPICGANLNMEKCDCQRKKGHPGFSKLENLKIKGGKT